MKITQPPSRWLKKSEDPLNLYKSLLALYPDDKKELAIVINKELSKIVITKEIAQKKSKILAKEIINLSQHEGNEQLRIFAVISASEASFYLMLASSLLGANHCICFEDLSEGAIASRIDIFQPHIILGTFEIVEKLVEAKKKSNFEDIPVSNIEEILRIKKFHHSQIIDYDFSSAEYSPEDILFTLFTSGSTGLPKAIRHTASRFARYAISTCKHFFKLDNKSIVFTATDAGWINGHTYAFYGPLLCGSTTVISEDLSKTAKPEYLDFILINCKVTCFYASVTLLRAIRQNVILNANFSHENNSLTLERVGSCGEPLANDVGKWVIQYFKPERKSIVNTYFQTETGGILTAPRDEDGFNSDYSNVGKPRNFIDIRTAKDLLSARELEEEEIEPNELLVPNSWDGIFHSVISDRATRYFTKKGYYRLHDVGYYGDDGSLFIGGRSDDVMNVAGHRVGSSEIENTIIEIEGIFESCAVAIPDDIMGTTIALFYSASTEVNEDLIRKKINEVLSEYHQPQYIFKFNNLPKTKSGKIMRRAMRSLASEGFLDSKSDYSTFVNRNEFLKDYSNFFNFWINRTIGFNKKLLFDLDLFCFSMCITKAKHLALPSLIIVIMQTIEGWEKEISQIKKIHISLKGLDELFHSCDIDFDDAKNILSIFEDVSSSPLQDESCLYDTSVLLISLSHVSRSITWISLVREPESNYFKIGVKLSNHCAISASKQISAELVDSIYVASPKYANKNSSNDYSRNKSDSEYMSVPVNKIKSVNDDEMVDKTIRCWKCQISMTDINEERGIDGYLLPIIRSDGKKTYLCNFCADGW